MINLNKLQDFKQSSKENVSSLDLSKSDLKVCEDNSENLEEMMEEFEIFTTAFKYR